MLILLVDGTFYHISKKGIKTLDLVGVTHMGYGDLFFLVQTKAGLMGNRQMLLYYALAPKESKEYLTRVKESDEIDQSMHQISQICCGENFAIVVYGNLCIMTF